MSELLVKGTQEFMGKEIPVVEGGFGEGKRCLTDKTVAEIHGMTTFNIRVRISSNIKRFKEDVDYIDLKVIYEINNNLELLQSLGYSKMQVSKAKHIYLLSERGYAKLIKIMDTDLAWEIHDKLMDEYFTMREKINSDEQLKAQLLLEIYNGGQSGVLASKQLTELEKKPLLEKIEEDKPKVDVYERFLNSDATFIATDLKGIFGFSSAITMNKKLHELKLIYKPKYSKTWTAYKDTPKNWYKVVVNEYEAKLRWTPEGILGIAKLLDIELSEDTIEDLINNDAKQ